MTIPHSLASLYGLNKRDLESWGCLRRPFSVRGVKTRGWEPIKEASEIETIDIPRRRLATAVCRKDFGRPTTTRHVAGDGEDGRHPAWQEVDAELSSILMIEE